MKYIKVTNLVKVIFVIVFFYTLLLTQVFIIKPNYPKLYNQYEYLTIILALFLLAGTMGLVVINKELINDFLLVLGPFFFVLVVSIVEVLVRDEMTLHYTISQNLIVIVPGLCGFFIVKILGEEVINLITYTCIANYTIYVVMYLAHYGLFGLTHFFMISDSHNYVKYLEVHEVTFIMGMLMIYYCLNSIKENIRKIVCLAIYIFLGYKRILFPAIAIAVILGWLIIKKYKKNVVMLISSLSFVVVTGWLFFVNSIYYEALASAFGIELNGRTFSNNGIYGRLAGFYNMSPLFMGHGVGFVLKILTEYAQLNGSNVYGFHNDILKYYIELGFIPFFVFIIMRVFFIPNKIYEHGTRHDVAVYVCVLMMTLICWTTDNLATYPNYLFVSFAIISCSVFGEKKEKVGSLN